VFSNVKVTRLFEHPIIEEVLKTRSTLTFPFLKKLSPLASLILENMIDL
jgi:hypothetical protein